MSLDNIMDMTDCTLCPRSCRVNRAEGEVGYCKEDAELYAARAALYFDEEPVISGRRGCILLGLQYGLCILPELRDR